jgi:hypothetical protein
MSGVSSRSAIYAGLFLVMFAGADTSARADLPAVEALAAKKVAIVELLHRKARRALVNAAQDEAFGKYFMAAHAGSRAHIKDRIDEISLEVQSHFRVEEMCLIGANGAEVSRIVGREIADDLASDESDAIFFKPAFAQPARKVHISQVYMSEDARKWVLAYVTPIHVEGQNKAILHYEHSLELFQNVLRAEEDEPERVVLAVDADGFVLSDSRRTIAIDERMGSDKLRDYFQRFSLDGLGLEVAKAKAGIAGREGSGTIQVGAQSFSIAMKPVEDWTIVVYEPAPMLASQEHGMPGGRR